MKESIHSLHFSISGVGFIEFDMVKVGSGLFSIALQRGTKRKALYTKSQKGKSLDQVLNETEGKETPPNEMKKGLKKKRRNFVYKDMGFRV